MLRHPWAIIGAIIGIVLYLVFCCFVGKFLGFNDRDPE